jgi:WD40 repeat protein
MSFFDLHSVFAMRRGGVAAFMSIAAGICALSSAASADDKVTYVDHVQPIFRQHCFTCHGPDTQKNDLALNSYASAMTGGASGEALAAGDPDASYLWQLVNHDAEPAMPPGGDKLPQAELDVIKAWIVGGLLEKKDSVARKSTKPAVAAFAPSADNRPEGEPAMPTGLPREPVLSPTHDGAPTALAVSPWAPLAAVGSPFQTSLYNTATGELLGVLPFAEGSPYALAFSRDGGLLLVGGGRSAALGVVALFDVKTGQRLTTIGDELDAVLAADLRADRSLVALGGPRKVARVYRVADGSLAYEITKHTDWVTAVEFSPDGKYLVTADRSGGMWLWEAETGRERGELRGHAEQVTAVAWRDDSAMLASASEDDTLRLWQLDGQQIKSWGAHGGGALSVAFGHDGRLVSAGRDARVKLWQGDGAGIRELAPLDDAALAARFTPDGKRVVATDWRGNVRVYDAESGAAVATLDPTPPTIDQRLAAAEAEAGQLRVAAQQSQEQVASAEQAVAAAESALTAARTALEEKKKLQGDATTTLQAAEARLASIAEEKAAWLRVVAEIAEKLAAVREQATGAETTAVEVRKEEEAAAAEAAKQKAVVDDLAAQLDALQKSLADAQERLNSLEENTSAKAEEAAAAENQAGELATQIEQLERRQAELEAIRKLREELK